MPKPDCPDEVLDALRRLRECERIELSHRRMGHMAAAEEAWEDCDMAEEVFGNSMNRCRKEMADYLRKMEKIK